MSRAMLAACAALLSGACGGREQVHIEPPVDDVPTIVIDEAALARAPTLTITEIARISGAHHALTFIRSPAVTDEHIVIADEGLHELLIFDSGGTLLSRTGGEGDGPGELRRPTAVAVGNDSIFVIDRNGLNIFGIDGEYIARSVINSGAAGSSGNMTVFPQSLHHDGGGLVTSFYVPGSSSVRVVRVHRLNPDGVVERPLHHVIEENIRRIGQSGMYAQPWFMSQLEFAVGDSGVVYVMHEDGVSVDVFTGPGEATSRVRFHVTRRAVTDADVDSMIDAIVQIRAAADVPLRREDARALPRHAVARYRAVIGSIVANGDLLFIRRADLSTIDSRAPNALAVWDLVRRDGTVLGRVSLPGSFRPRHIDEGRVIGVQMDAMEVPDIVVYALR